MILFIIYSSECLHQKLTIIFWFILGFDFNNYKSFMFKQVLMRIEKDIIKE